MIDGTPFSLSCSAILFDLDGVLVDSATCVEKTWRLWAERHELDAEQVISVAHGRRTIETIQMLAPHLMAADEAAVLAASESQTTDGVFEVRARASYSSRCLAIAGRSSRQASALSPRFAFATPGSPCRTYSCALTRSSEASHIPRAT